MQWRNEIAYQEDTGRRYKLAFKEATKLLADLKAGNIANPLTQQEYIDKLHVKYTLDGEGKDGCREKHILALSTIRRAVSKGIVGVSPKKKG